ncbi:MAG: hypothetical protein QOH76_3932 [Thermoleophilaceae bacterium]|nr:hypothetical protein [Thermoleophilaceae bacterium]
MVALLFLALPAGSASAGRLIVTGHDQDLHCSGGDGCHFIAVAVNWVRAKAPDPSKPVLILDRDQNQMVAALDAAFPPAGTVPRVVMDPRSAQFATTPLSTSTYSAILIASDYTCGGCDLNQNDAFDPNITPDSDAINKRSKAIADFFNAGGGLFAAAGASHGDGNPSNGKESYYQFVPVPLGGLEVTAPFTLTPAGQALGFTDDANSPNGSDINCCATHNSFREPPAGSPLKVAERDFNHAPETLFAEGTIFGGTIVDKPPPPPVEGKSVNVTPVSGTVLVKLPPGKSGKQQGGAHAAAKGFIPLAQARQIPVGSILDTSRGTVKLIAARNKNGSRTQSGNFNGGQFRIGQRRKNPLTEVSMVGGGLAACKTRVPKGGSAARKRKRRIFGNARGRFRTRGRHSSATVRGTKWSMTDTCAGTTTVVTKGSVTVRDFTLRKTRIVKAGHRYFARAPKRK